MEEPEEPHYRFMSLKQHDVDACMILYVVCVLLHLQTPSTGALRFMHEVSGESATSCGLARGHPKVLREMTRET